MLDLCQKHSYLHRLWGRVKVSGYQHKRQGRHGTLPFVATSRGPAQQAKWSTHLSWATGATPPSPPTPAAEDDGRGWDGACHVMAAVAASSAKRSLRAELKQRLRALSAEERLRQSHLLTQKVREGFGELNAWKLGFGWRVCAGAPLPLCVRVLVGRALAPPGWPGRAASEPSG